MHSFSANAMETLYPSISLIMSGPTRRAESASKEKARGPGLGTLRTDRRDLVRPPHELGEERLGRIPADIFRRWIRVPEEDQAGVLRYRPECDGVSLPLRRPPRPILELTQDGRVVQFVAGPTDARIARPGRWESTAEGLRFLWDDRAPTTVVEIAALDDSILELRVLAGQLE